ncbi:MAG: MFS transporter [Propionibacteriaceae bacterium]
MAGGLSVYGRLLADRPARAFTLAALVARMPLSMTGLGIVLLVSIETGSFTRAGLVSATVTVATAICSPWWGRRIDHVGQAPVLLLTIGTFVVGLIGIIATVLLGFPLPLTLVAAVVTGVGAPVAGACVRARWAYRSSDEQHLNTAYAYEAVMDEVVFIIGPVLATFLATTVASSLGLIAAAVLGLGGTLALAAQRSTQPPAHAPSRPSSPDHPRLTSRPPISRRLLIPVVLACAALGVLFGGMEVVIIAFATEAGILRLAGLLAMAWAAGSLVAGVATGTVEWRSSPARRFRVAALALAASLVPLSFVDRPWLVAALLVVSGLAIAPTLIASVAVTQASVPAGRLTEALGWTQLGLYAGVGAGAAVVGRVIDVGGAHGGFLTVAAAGGLLVVAALTVRTPPSAASVMVRADDHPG